MGVARYVHLTVHSFNNNRDAILKNLLTRSDDCSIEDVFEVYSLGALMFNIHTIHAAATQI